MRLPVPPSRGNFYEAGLSKALFGRVRVDASYFSRQMRDVADDDLLLNTGVSFPIAFPRADIRGAEVKVDVPRWKNVPGSLSYSHLRGVGDLPITGGLFLGDEAAALLSSHERFPVTQDQRHTVRGRVSYSRGPWWAAAAASYGSGLPFEDVNGDPGRGDRAVRRRDCRSRELRDRARAPELVTRSVGRRWCSHGRGGRRCGFRPKSAT